MIPKSPNVDASIPAALDGPAKEPIRAWEEEEGMPYHQVMRFQAIAAIRAAVTINSP